MRRGLGFEVVFEVVYESIGSYVHAASAHRVPQFA